MYFYIILLEELDARGIIQPIREVVDDDLREVERVLGPIRRGHLLQPQTLDDSHLGEGVGEHLHEGEFFTLTRDELQLRGIRLWVTYELQMCLNHIDLLLEH